MTDAGLKQKLFSFDGRLRRRDWWLLGLAVALVQFVVMLSVHLLVSEQGEPFLGTLRITESGLSISTSWWVATGISTLALCPQLAMGVKRGHDIGWSAAWTTVLYLIGFLAGLAPYDFGAALGAQIDAGRTEFYAPLALLVVSMIVNVVLVAALGFVDGRPEANRYGTSPKFESVDPGE